MQFSDNLVGLRSGHLVWGADNVRIWSCIHWLGTLYEHNAPYLYVKITSISCRLHLSPRRRICLCLCSSSFTVPFWFIFYRHNFMSFLYAAGWICSISYSFHCAGFTFYAFTLWFNHEQLKWEQLISAPRYILSIISESPYQSVKCLVSNDREKMRRGKRERVRRGTNVSYLSS